MDHLGNSLLVEHEARRRQDLVAAEAEHRALLSELSSGQTLREGVAQVLVNLAHWLAPERNYTEMRRATIGQLAR